MLIRLGRMGRIGGATRTQSVIIPAFGAAGAATIPMQTLSGESTSPAQLMNPTTGAATSGDGAIVTSSTDVSVTYGTTTTSARFSHTVVNGQRYRVTWTQTGSSNAQTAFGTSAGGGQYRPTLAPVQGTTFDFTSVGTMLWVNAQRVGAGTTVFSNFVIQPIAEVTWTDITPSLINKAGWSLSATVTVDGTTGAITIPATGSVISARQEITGLTQGVNYRLRWVNGSNSTQALLGISNGNGLMKSASSSDAVGSRTYEFVAQSATTNWVQFQRSTSGTAVVSDIEFQQVL